MMFFVDLLFQLPIWAIAVVLTLATTGFALGGKVVVRRWVLPRLKLEYEDAYYAAALVQSAMLLWGLIAALTAVGVWQRYTDVANVVSAEATAIASLNSRSGTGPVCGRACWTTSRSCRDWKRTFWPRAWLTRSR